MTFVILVSGRSVGGREVKTYKPTDVDASAAVTQTHRRASLRAHLRVSTYPLAITDSHLTSTIHHHD